MTLLKLHLGLIGITVNCMAVSVIQHNLIITQAFESAENDKPPSPTPLESTETKTQKVIEKRHIIQPEPVCEELKQLVTDASIHAANLSMKELYKVFMYGDYHFN